MWDLSLYRGQISVFRVVVISDGCKEFCTDFSGKVKICHFCSECSAGNVFLRVTVADYICNEDVVKPV